MLKERRHARKKEVKAEVKGRRNMQEKDYVKKKKKQYRRRGDRFGRRKKNKNNKRASQ